MPHRRDRARQQVARSAPIGVRVIMQWVEIQMPSSGTRGDACQALDADLAESIVLQAYVQLPLLPPQADGSRVAPLKSFAHCDLRLVEEVAGDSDQPVLRVELFDRRAR